MRIAIAGAGIGGLAAALALSADGHDVCVYEAAPELLPLGVGINLLPHAALILEGYGVVDRLLQSGVETRELVYHNRYGQRIWAEPRGRFAGFDAPQISLSRGALHLGLLEMVEQRFSRDRVVRDRRLAAFSQDDSRVDMQFTDMSGGAHAASADILVCADGIHSAARASLYPGEGRPIYSGRTLWRATSFAKPYLTGATMIMAGHQDQKFVCYPIEPVRADGLQRINWIAELRIEEFRRREDWNREGRLEDFYPRFKSWKFDWLDIPGLIAGADVIYEYPMVDRDPLPQMEPWADDAPRRCGARDVSDRLERREPGDPRCRCAGHERCARTRIRWRPSPPMRRVRLPATAAIVRANRQNGPEHCMQLAEERSPDRLRPDRGRLCRRRTAGDGRPLQGSDRNEARHIRSQAMTIETKPLMDFEVEVGKPVTIDAGAQGRRFIPITGGRVSGQWTGSVVPGGADWQIIWPDGRLDLEARYALDIDGHGLVEVLSQGVRHRPAGCAGSAWPRRSRRSVTLLFPDVDALPRDGAGTGTPECDHRTCQRRTRQEPRAPFGLRSPLISSATCRRK